MDGTAQLLSAGALTPAEFAEQKALVLEATKAKVRKASPVPLCYTK
jgi:hypothetical protein